MAMQTTDNDRHTAYLELIQRFDSELDASKDCERCKGSGQVTDWRDKSTLIACNRCSGAGTFVRPNFAAIADKLVITRKGVTGIRKSRGKLAGREYYTWRMVQFHSGRDVSLPMIASMDIDGDPYADALDAFARVLTMRWFNRRSVGRSRWRRALGAE